MSDRHPAFGAAGSKRRITDENRRQRYLAVAGAVACGARTVKGVAAALGIREPVAMHYVSGAVNTGLITRDERYRLGLPSDAPHPRVEE